MNVLDVHAAALEAVSRAKKGEGPTLLECKTYRYTGHGAYDTGLDYRTQEEINEWKTRDPIDRFEQKLVTEKLVAIEELRNIRNKVRSKIENAVKFAQDRPYPSESLLAKFVWG
jgi:pyruvate dehydrogenase E1 component alpha subunit